MPQAFSLSQSHEAPTLLEATRGEILLGKSLWFYEDQGHGLAFEDVLKKAENGYFSRHHSDVFKRGITDSSFWFKLSVALPRDALDQAWLFEVSFPWLSQVAIYYRDDDGQFVSHKTGYRRVFHSRQLLNKGFVFPLPMAPGEVKDFYFNVVADGQTLFPIKAVSAQAYMTNKTIYNMTMAIFYGILLAMLVYNFFVFVALRSTSYFLYVTLIFALICMSFVVDGYGYMFLWPDRPQLNIHLSYLLPLVVSLLMLSVTMDFMELRSRGEKHRYNLLSWLVIVAIAAVFVLPSAITAMMTVVVSAVVLCSILWVSLLRVLEGYQPARYFLMAWICLLIGSLAKIAVIMGFLPHNVMTAHSVHIGATLQVLLLAFALGNRISSLERERNRLKSRVINEANKSSRIKNEFLALISHELRTPMNGVEGALELMKTKALDAEMNGYIETASNSATDMTLLIDSILNFSEAQSGRLKLEENPFSLKQLLKPIQRRYDRRCSEKGLLFDCQISPAVPKYLVGDIKKIAEVIDKLLDNAVKFTEQGAVTLSVSVQDANLAEGVCLGFQIIDTGAGFAEADGEVMFQSFNQQETPYRRKYGGLGIGLAMCKQLVRLMDGELKFSSQPDSGSQFQLLLTLKRADPEQIRLLSLEANKLAADKNLKPKQRPQTIRILVVEDNNVNRKVLSGILTKLGCDVLTANNGVEAIDVLNKKRVDLVLMDCQMPVMDGFEATRLIRQKNFANKKVPIIAVTANAMSEDERLCKNAGMDDFVKKPVKKAVIEEKLAHWLDYKVPEIS